MFKCVFQFFMKRRSPVISYFACWIARLIRYILSGERLVSYIIHHIFLVHALGADYGALFDDFRYEFCIGIRFAQADPVCL